ncbi:hypothetical protein PCANB_002040 [Pneumocystis canis]|nr:hypothetical protein PCK1_001898 [Pneumocystis canis]KAG5439466.1 hypothetical protein PCANB_002040 [Pneumocystis canis]
MDAEYWKNIELNLNKQNISEKNHDKELFFEQKNKDHILSAMLLDNDDLIYQDLSLFPFKSQCELSIVDKGTLNQFDHESKTINHTKLVNLDDDFSEKIENSSSFDVSFFDNLPILSNNSTENNHEKTIEDIFEVFNRPIKDFFKDKAPINDNNLYVQEDLLNFNENNEHSTLKNKIAMQLIDMGFCPSQVYKEIEMVGNKFNINTIISTLMTINFLNNEKEQNTSKSNNIESSKEDFRMRVDSKLSSKFLNKVNMVFNQGKVYVQKLLKNDNTKMNDSSNFSKVPGWMEYEPSLLNQEPFKQKKESNEIISNEISISVIEKNDDILLDLSSDQCNYRSLSPTVQSSESFLKDIETPQKHQVYFEDLIYYSENPAKYPSYKFSSKDLIFENTDFLSIFKIESIEQPNLSISSSLINQINIDRKTAFYAINNGDYSKALKLYTKAIESLPSDHILRTLLLDNRSLCYLQTGNPKASILDCDELLKLIKNIKDAEKGITFDKDIKNIWKKIMIRRAQSLQLERFEKTKNQQKPIDKNIKRTAEFKAEKCCVKTFQSDILNIDDSKDLKNKIDVNMEPYKYSNQKDTIDVSLESEVSKKVNIVNTLDFENEEKLLLYDKVKEHINRWADGKECNLRALLSTLNQVLWDNLGWENINMANLLSTSQVKKAYIKAISKIHPDKLPKNTLLEQKMIASSVFNYLNHAWNNFKTENSI